MRIIIFIVIATFMWFFANKKGFNPWLWVLAAGILGLIVLLCLPSAAAEGLDDATKQKRRKTGNTVGAVITVIAVIGIVVVIVLLSSL